MAELLKNIYNENFINELSLEIKRVYHNFDDKFFINSLLDDQWESYAMKERMNKITYFLEKSLHINYHQQLEVLEQVSPKFHGLKGIIFPDFIEKFGLDYFEDSMEALKYHTQFSTAEFAIRHFILKYGDNCLERIYDWSNDPNFHVRRLASEGTRPILPWGIKLHDYVKNPNKTLPILENLKNDKEDYVYRSVANHLNDISKNHSDLVLDISERWMKNPQKNTQWIIKHALRTLLKKGHPKALSIFGFYHQEKIIVNQFTLSSNQIKIGESAELEIYIENRSQKKTKVRLEFVVDYLKNNKKHSSKVFQIKEFELESKNEFKVCKKIDFKNLTTRKHYPGIHYIWLQINGVKTHKLEFKLV